MFFTLHEGRRRRRSAVVLRLSNDQRRSANGRQISDRPAESFVFTAGFEDWCGRGDSNPYDIAIASPSSWCVCQFRHFRLGQFDVSNLTTLDNRLPSSETLAEVYGRRGTPTTKDGNAGHALRREAQA